MRRLSTLFAGALLASSALACGGTGAGKDTRSPAADTSRSSTPGSTSAADTRPSAKPSHGYLRIDGDADDDDRSQARSAVNDDRELFEIYGKTATPADANAIRRLVMSYYAAAATGDAVVACSLLHADLAAQLAAHARWFGQAGARTCAQAMSALQARQHRRLLAEDVATMRVTSVHVKGGVGLAVLGFEKVPQATIVLERQGRTWKMDALFDSDLT